MCLLCTILFQATGCGYIFHHERVGNSTEGQVDVGIVLLDALGLVFFIIPGIIAFAVDYSTGTLFLPYGHHNKLVSMRDIKHSKAIKLDKNKLQDSDIEESIKAHTDISISLRDAETIRA